MEAFTTLVFDAIPVAVRVQRGCDRVFETHHTEDENLRGLIEAHKSIATRSAPTEEKIASADCQSELPLKH